MHIIDPFKAASLSNGEAFFYTFAITVLAGLAGGPLFTLLIALLFGAFGVADMALNLLMCLFNSVFISMGAGALTSILLFRKVPASRTRWVAVYPEELADTDGFNIVYAANDIDPYLDVEYIEVPDRQEDEPYDDGLWFDDE